MNTKIRRISIILLIFCLLPMQMTTQAKTATAETTAWPPKPKKETRKTGKTSIPKNSNTVSWTTQQKKLFPKTLIVPVNEKGMSLINENGIEQYVRETNLKMGKPLVNQSLKMQCTNGVNRNTIYVYRDQLSICTLTFQINESQHIFVGGTVHNFGWLLEKFAHPLAWLASYLWSNASKSSESAEQNIPKWIIFILAALVTTVIAEGLRWIGNWFRSGGHFIAERPSRETYQAAVAFCYINEVMITPQMLQTSLPRCKKELEKRTAVSIPKINTGQLHYQKK